MLTDKIKEIDKQTEGNILEAIRNEKFKFIDKDGKHIGFFTWFNYGRKVFINNMYVEPEYRNKSNLLWIRKFIRDLYNRDYQYVYWKNKKHNDRVFICR